MHIKMIFYRGEMKNKGTKNFCAFPERTRRRFLKPKLSKFVWYGC